jgi:hypothetical protein
MPGRPCAGYQRRHIRVVGDGKVDRLLGRLRH